MVYDIDIHELNLGLFKDLKFLDEISFKKCVFFAFLNNKCRIIYLFREKTTLSYQRRGDFINGHCIIFFNFLLFDNVL
jgi:Fe-S-cluster containining protein